MSNRSYRVHVEKTGKEQYLTIGYPMLRSHAWRSLRGSSIKVYFELHTRFHGGNNGTISFSLNEAAKALRLGKETVQRALEELEAKGFIVRTRKGMWYGRKASHYALTTKPFDGHQATHAYKQWVQPAKRDGSQNAFLGSTL